MKYIIVEYKGLDVPIIFPDFVPHDEIQYAASKQVITAGFVNTTPISDQFIAYGNSVSLKVESSPLDSEIITRAMNFRA